MSRRMRAVVFVLALAAALGSLMIGVSVDVRADPKPPVVCGGVTCKTSELCCTTGCPPIQACLKKERGQCPPPFPCPQP